MIKDDGLVLHFNNPKVQASLAANTFVVVGHAEMKQITEMLPGILNQLGPESLQHLKKLASVGRSMTSSMSSSHKITEEDDDNAAENDGDDEDEDDVPDLVENFDEPSKTETVVTTSA